MRAIHKRFKGFFKMGKYYEYNPFDSESRLKFCWGPYVLIILNQPIRLHPSIMCELWKDAVYRVIVDGGADRWLNYLKEHNIKLENQFPDFVSGDFDSIKSDTFSLLKENEVKLVHTPDQNFNDFHKAVNVISDQKLKDKCNTVLVICESSGRLDQVFANINTLNSISKILDYKTVPYMLAKSSLTWLLHPGEHKIHTPKWVQKYWCAILPFSKGATNVTTSGLYWDLDGQEVEFGGLISSSNKYSGESHVTIKNESTLIWTMGIDEE